MAEEGAHDQFSILIVCTGNICRSPLAEQVLRARLDALEIPVRVSSAGSNAVTGHAMTPEAAIVSNRKGGRDVGHVARQLTQGLVASADLVITATRDHRSAVVGLHPRAARYTYTLNQFTRLVTPQLESGALRTSSSIATDPDIVAPLLRSLVSEIAASRGLQPPPENPADDDIEDPYRQSMAVYDRVGDLIDAGVTRLTQAFAAVTGRDSAGQRFRPAAIPSAGLGASHPR